MTELTEERLRDQLRAIADWTGPIDVPAVPTAEVTMLPLEPVHQRRARQVWAIVGIAATMVVALVAVSTSRPQPAPIADGRWLPMAAAPIPPRSMPATAWTGEEVIVVGGEAANGEWLSDAAAYNPTTNTWRRLPDAPAPVGPGSQTALTDEVLVVGVPDAAARVTRGLPLDSSQAVLLDRATESWRAIEEPGHLLALATVDGTVISLSRPMPFRTGDGVRFRRLDPTTGRWVPGTNLFGVEWTGPDRRGVTAWTAVTAGHRAMFFPLRWTGPAAGGPPGFVVEALDEEAQPVISPWLDQSVPTVGWVETRVVGNADGEVFALLLGYDDGGGLTTAFRRYDPTWKGWDAIDNPAPDPAGVPLDEGFFRTFGFTATDNSVIVTGGVEQPGFRHGDGMESAHSLYVAFDPRSERWSSVTRPPLDLNRVGHVSIWTGRELVVWGGLRRSDGAPVNRVDQPARGGARFAPSA